MNGKIRASALNPPSTNWLLGGEFEKFVDSPEGGNAPLLLS